MSKDNPCGENERQCTKCGLFFPKTTEYFMRHKTCKDGLHNWCRTCYSAYQRDHYSNNREARLAQKAIYRDEHREEIKAQHQKYNDEHREEKKEYYKQYYVEHKEKRTAFSRQYAREHLEEFRIYSRIRRSRKKGAGGKFFKRDVRNLYEMQNGCCCWCGKPMVNRLLYKKVPPELYWEMFTIDHITAVRRGGSNWWWNIVLVCWDCNSSRKQKHVFMEWQPPAMLGHMQEYIVRSVILELWWGWWMWKVKAGKVG